MPTPTIHTNNLHLRIFPALGHVPLLLAVRIEFVAELLVDHSIRPFLPGLHEVRLLPDPLSDWRSLAGHFLWTRRCFIGRVEEARLIENPPKIQPKNFPFRHQSIRRKLLLHLVMYLWIFRVQFFLKCFPFLPLVILFAYTIQKDLILLWLFGTAFVPPFQISFYVKLTSKYN